jgi:hypothetical protein
MSNDRRTRHQGALPPRTAGPVFRFRLSPAREPRGSRAGSSMGSSTGAFRAARPPLAARSRRRAPPAPRRRQGRARCAAGRDHRRIAAPPARNRPPRRRLARLDPLDPRFDALLDALDETGAALETAGLLTILAAKGLACPAPGEYARVAIPSSAPACGGRAEGGTAWLAARISGCWSRNRRWKRLQAAIRAAGFCRAAAAGEEKAGIECAPEANGQRAV